MNHILKAVLLGILGWILIFVEISIFQIAFGLIGIIGILIHFIFLIIFTIFLSKLYYKGLSKKTRFKGYALGILFLIVGTILDLIVMPAFVNLSEFYSRWDLWLGFAIVILTAEFYQRLMLK